MNLPWTTKLTSGGAEVRTRVWWSLESKFLILGGAPLPSLPPKCSLWGWRSVGLRTRAAIGFPRCLPVCIPPCKLFAPPPPFCERGLQLLVGLFFLSSTEARFLWVWFTRAAPGRDVSSHSVSEASLILAGWMAEPWRRGEEAALVGSARIAQPCSVSSGAAGVRAAPASWCVFHRFCRLPFLGARSPGASGCSGRAGRSLHLWDVEAELGLGAMGESPGVAPRVTADPGTCHAGRWQ